MKGIEFVWEAVADLPAFFFMLYFELGFVSVLFWAFLLFFLLTAYISRDEGRLEKKLELEAEQHRIRCMNLKRYSKNRVTNNEQDD